MAIDLAKLANQGRAHSVARAWTPEELDALLTLERERGIARQIAAEYIRNGVVTVEDYDNALKKGVEPKSLEDIHAEAEEAVKKETKAKLGATKKK